MFMEESLAAKTIIFSFNKKPVEEQEYKENPPPTSRKGDDSSIAFAISGLSLKVAVNALTGPRAGFVAHTISHGSIPLTAKTAINKP